MKVMLYSDMPPCTNYTAGIVLNILCRFLLDAGHEVCCVYVIDKSLEVAIPHDIEERMAFLRIDRPCEYYGRKLKGVSGKLLSLFGNNFEAIVRLPKIAKQAAAFARENKADLLWSVVQGQTMIKTTRLLAKSTNLPYAIQIWDPPTWWLREYGFDGVTIDFVLKEYSLAIRDSMCCITASEAMNAEYLKRYSPGRAVPVILGFDPTPVAPVIKKLDTFVIALSGQTYASAEMLALIKALNTLEWRYHEKQIILRLYGRNFEVLQHLQFAEQANIEIRGWLSQEKLLSELAKSDLCYCPYWFDPVFKEEASLAFPSKLSTYLKTAAPVLIHAPEYASPRKFIEEHNAGYVCGSLDAKIIADALRAIMDDPDRLAVGERGYQVFCEYLSLDVMRRNFLFALNL